MTFWFCGRNSSTLGRSRTRSHRIGATRSTETELGISPPNVTNPLTEPQRANPNVPCVTLGGDVWWSVMVTVGQASLSTQHHPTPFTVTAPHRDQPPHIPTQRDTRFERLWHVGVRAAVLSRRETPYTSHPKPYTLHPTPDTPHPTPYTLHPTPHTLHPTPYTLHPKP